MTSHNQRASSARIAPARSEPGIALTVFWPIGPVILSTRSLSSHSQMFNRRRVFVSFTATAASKARPERQGVAGDTRPVDPVLPNGCISPQKASS
jgi:hypothetical protein